MPVLFEIRFHPSAEAEYKTSTSWYEDSKTGLGEQFVKKVEYILDHIERNPFLFPVKKRKFREAVVDTFPYTVIYEVNKRTKVVIILSVFNTKQKPSKISKKKIKKHIH